MRYMKKTLGLLAAAPLAVLVGCGEMEEPPQPAGEPGMEQQQQDWLPPTEEAPPPEGGMRNPPAEEGEGGMGTPRPPEGDMPEPRDGEGSMGSESPEGASDDR